MVEDVNLQVDLYDVDELEIFKEENYAYYEQGALDQITERAKDVSEAYERYFEATSKITLNKDNLEDHLFSYVSYQYCEN